MKPIDVRRERPTALTSDPEETVDLIPTAAAATGPSSAATEGCRWSSAGPPLTEGQLFWAHRWGATDCITALDAADSASEDAL